MMKNQSFQNNSGKVTLGRFYAVIAVLVVLGVLVFTRIARNQVLDGEEGKDFLQAQGEARSLRTEPIIALRGMITDRFGEPLAVSTPVVTVWANPKFLNQEARPLRPLADALDIDLAELQKKVNSGKGFVYLKRQMSPDSAQQVMALNYPGVFAQREYRRFYPAGEVTSHVVGFTDMDDNGQEGMELAYNNILKGQMGSKRVLKDLSGRVIKDVQLVKSAEPGQTLQLSIDMRLQYLAYRSLKQAVTDFKAKAGTVVVLDSTTGEVLAMVNIPTYNPNNRTDLSTDSLRNRAITDVFEPGSTIKPFSMSVALGTGRYKPETLIDTNPGSVRVGRKLLKDHHNNGVIDLTQIIARSSQVGMTKVALTLPGEDIRGILHRVGFGQVTASGFPGESAGVLPNYRKWAPIVQATMAFGYGISVTPLQLAQAYSVFANGGVKKPVSLLRLDTDAAQHRVTETVMPPAIAHELVSMMEHVTQAGGTATRAAVTAYRISGKTGTAHKAEGGAYSEKRYTAVFAGMAPATRPRFVTVVMIDEPSSNKYYGGEVAAPVFSEVMSTALRLYSVPPDGDQQVVDAQPAPIAEKQAAVKKRLS
jgi:cell division protein FtsI (penicillin-binding protein 3)